MSSLAAQLAQSASLNSSLLVERTKRKPGESYLFTGREADHYDLDSIHALASNGFMQLASSEPSMQDYEDQLLSERAKMTDRTLLTIEANEELNKAIDEILMLLGPHLMDAPTGKLLEWLVRRFRINEFNVESVLSLFLPYHESPHFAKMITILHIRPNSKWSFLLPYKSAGQRLSRVSLVTEMIRNSEVARFVISLLPNALKKERAHRVLFAFNAACLHDFITRSKSMDEGTIAYLFPALLEPLKQETAETDAILGSYILLSTLSQRCEFSKAAIKSSISSMAKCATSITTKQFVSAAMAVCESQVELQSFSDSVMQSILALPSIEEEVRSATVWIGSEKFISPLMQGSAQRLTEDNAISLLEVVITAPGVSTVIIERFTSTLMRVATSPDSPAEEAVSAHRLLSIIQQRYPSLLNSVVQKLAEEGVDTPAMEQLILSLSTVPGTKGSVGGKNYADLIVASNNPDAQTRAIALKQLIKSSDSTALSEPDMGSIHAAVLSRVSSTDIQVIEALYEQKSALTSLLYKDANAFIDVLSQALNSPGVKPKRSILRIHFTYLLRDFYSKADFQLRDRIFYEILIPFLLFSKPRQHTAELVWDIIEECFTSADSEFPHQWLAGCMACVKLERGKNISDALEKMNNINISLSSQISKNILASNNFAASFELLIEKLQHSNAYTRALCSMVTRALIMQLSGEDQVNAAHSVMKVMSVEKFMDLPQNSDLLDANQDVDTGKKFVLKPNSNSTLAYLQISVITAVATIPRPSGCNLDWLSDLSPNSSDDRWQLYVTIMRDVYRLANLTADPILITNILRALFVSLKDDSLAFLAGIWTGAVPEPNGKEDIHNIALQHAAAFLEAHVLEDDGVDFQTILPSLLVALQAKELQTRLRALECLTRIHTLTERKLSSVYKFDVIYGQTDRQLQYLDRDDLKRYLSGLLEHWDHFLHDSSYLQVFHEQHLLRSKEDKKRDIEYKHRVLCCLVSHINALNHQLGQIALLHSVNSIQDKAKALVLLPALHSLVVAASSVQPSEIFSTYSEEFTNLALSCITASAATEMNTPESSLWTTFALSLRVYFKTGAPISPRDVLANRLEDGLFSALSHDRKVTVCEILLELGSQDPDAYASCKKLLARILQDVSLIVHLLDSFAPPAESSGPRAYKRTKTSEPPRDSLPRLSLLVEILGSISLPGSIDLISQLLDVLNRVVQSTTPTQDVSYIEQLLMSAVESAAVNIQEPPNLSPSVVRLDILVEVIRVADNTQTFHQALLLMSSLARLAPDSVLQNVMPVFTFMGSNVFHRDDSYSFRVVQQTIDGIVPVMASSLRKENKQSLDLYIASKKFLRVFTDAANHIPRHRRNNFFAHLVDVLGPNDFLASVAMLLIEKVANRVIRQGSDDIQSSLSLPVSLLHHNSEEIATSTLIEILLEVKRLATRVIIPGSLQTVFLENDSDGEHSSASNTAMKRRAQALATFVGYALKTPTVDRSTISSASSVANLTSLLIEISVMEGGSSTDTKIDEICQAARSSLNRVLRVMSAIDFVDAVVAILESGDKLVQAGALELFGERLPDITASTRSQISPKVIKIVQNIKKILTMQDNGNLLLYGLYALRSICLTMCSGEESSITDTTPIVLAVLKVGELASSALAALAPMCVKLGPRILPFFRDIVTQAVTFLGEEKDVLKRDSFGVLHGLLSSIPSFWGLGEIKLVLMLYIRQHGSNIGSTSQMSSLMKAVTKHVASKVVLPGMLEVWESLKTSIQMASIIGYFELLSRSLRAASRPVVLEHLRGLFNIFLEAFNIVKASADNNAGSQAITAFKELVVHLNESAFRPLFRRLYDWAFANEESDPARKVIFCRVYIGLLDFFRGLMLPYMTFLMPPFVDTLKSFKDSVIDDTALWTCTLETLTKSFYFDDGGFWRDDRLREISAPIVDQVNVCINLGFSDGKSTIQDCLGALTEAVTDDTLLKSINLNLLMHTRSEDVQVRLFALTCSEALWRAHGGKLLGFVAETTTFIAECGEDENDMVVRESFRLKDAVESVAGKLDGI